MGAGLAETQAGAGPPRTRRGVWVALAAVGVLAAAYIAATASTHATLSAGAMGWADPVAGRTTGLGPVTAADRAFIGPTPGFGLVLWAARPGGTVAVGLTEHVVCDPTIRRDARLPGDPARTAWLGDATSPVIVRYRVLGLTMSQTVAVASPLMVAQPYRACK